MKRYYYSRNPQLQSMLVGHQKQWQFLKRMAEEGTLPHGLLFSGPAGIGKKKIAQEFAKMLFCEAGNICQRCISCREVERGFHPDLLLLEPKNDKVPIQDIIRLGANLSLKPIRGDRKIVIIDEVQRMRRESQSALLKVLEDPPGLALIILTSSRHALLLSTIRSRVQEIKFFPFRREEQESVHERVAGEEFFSLFDSDLFSRFRYAKATAESGSGSAVVVQWMQNTRRLLFSLLKKGGGFGEVQSILRLVRFLNILQEKEVLLATTAINRQLALEVILLEMPYLTLCVRNSKAQNRESETA